MKTFILIKKQHNTGCDYTIGCGTTVEVIKANSKEEIIEKRIPSSKEIEGCEWYIQLSNLILDSQLTYADTYSEVLCDEINLYEISDQTDLLSIYKEKIKKIEDYKQLLEKDHEYKEYLKLKEKYESCDNSFEKFASNREKYGSI